MVQAPAPASEDSKIRIDVFASYIHGTYRQGGLLVYLLAAQKWGAKQSATPQKGAQFPNPRSTHAPAIGAPPPAPGYRGIDRCCPSGTGYAACLFM